MLHSHVPTVSLCLFAQFLFLFICFVCSSSHKAQSSLSFRTPCAFPSCLELDYSHSRVSIAPCGHETVLHTKDEDAVVVADALGEVEVGIDRVAVDGV